MYILIDAFFLSLFLMVVLHLFIYFVRDFLCLHGFLYLFMFVRSLIISLVSSLFLYVFSLYLCM